MPVAKKFNAYLGNNAVTALKSRKFDAYYCETKEAATEKALSLIDKNGVTTWGGSMTLSDVGIIKALYDGGYNILDRETKNTLPEQMECAVKAFSSDCYLMSSNAVSLTGSLINIDGLGNRVAALAFGPKQVIVIVGINKLVNTEEEGLLRARRVAAPMNAIRLNRDTPCSKTGICYDCTSDGCICKTFTITRMTTNSRIKIIIVGEHLGY